jgi:hypothetical protein
MPAVTCPMPDQESSQVRSAWSARSYDGPVDAEKAGARHRAGLFDVPRSAGSAARSSAPAEGLRTTTLQSENAEPCERVLNSRSAVSAFSSMSSLNG